MKLIVKLPHFLIYILFFTIPIAWWTRLNANYHSTKMTLFYLIGGLAWLGVAKTIRIPKLSKLMLYSLIGIIAGQVIKHTYALSFYDLLFFVKVLCFWGLVLYLYSQDLDLDKVFKKTTYAILLMTVTMLSISLYEFYILRIVKMSLLLTLLGTFGNINMYAEFFVLTLPFLFHWTRYKDKIPYLLKLTIFSLWLFLILYCRSRSTWIGLVFWLPVLFRYKASKKELIGIGLALIMYAVSMLLPSQNFSLLEAKESSFKERMGLYEATIDLIKDHPWGVKAGRFMSEVEPYQLGSSVMPSEAQYFDQPHSEFLKWTAQFGWLFAILVFMVLGFIIYYLVQWFVKAESSFLVGTFLVLLPQMSFQFPFENPASLMYLSLPTALFLLKFASEKNFKIHIAFRPVMLAFFLAGLYSSVGFLNAVYQESTYPRKSAVVEACEFYPINTKTCYAKLGYYLDSKLYQNFITEFKTDFMKQPFFVDYLKLLPTYYSIQQNNKKTCEALFFYQTIFPQQKAFEQRHYDKCTGFSNPFHFDNPKSFEESYLSWLNNLN